MREDLRHKIWMIALSALGSFLALPMPWLLVRSNMHIEWEGNFERAELSGKIEDLVEFFGSYLIAAGAFICIIAGFTVGLCAFRYLFHKNRVDTYHSLPVKRSTLFTACYVDGILIWIVPFSICLLLTLVMAGGVVGRFGGTGAVMKMLELSGRNILVLLVAFLVIYNLVLVSVMVSGNILNTLVSIVLLGFGVISVYGIWQVYLESYMLTYYSPEFSGLRISYASPLFSAFYLLITAGNWEDNGGYVWVMLAVNLAVAVILGVCAWILYQRRPSELAEQGIRNKAFAAFLRVAAGIVSGMVGWRIFVMIVDDMTGVVGLAWKGFGAALAAVLVFGVLDVVFQMDFKAFFAHKLQMAGMVLMTLFICVAFQRDWLGYDTYLPDKEDIAEMAIYNDHFNNRYSWYQWMENMHCQDVDTIYAYLEYASGLVSKLRRGISAYDWSAGTERVITRISLKSGRTYYRSYYLPADSELLWSLFTSEEYLEQAYLIDEAEIGKINTIRLYREGVSGTSIEDSGAAAAIARAYNQDVREHYEEILVGEGRLLAQVHLKVGEDGRGYIIHDRENYTYWLNIYSTMEHTIEAMKEAGFAEWVDTWDAADVSVIELSLLQVMPETATVEDILEEALNVYGIESDGVLEDYGGTARPSGGEAATIEGYDGDWEAEIQFVLQITDQAEIEELLEYISYSSYRSSGNSIRKGYVKILVVDQEGRKWDRYIQRGSLPMKYILRFGDLAEQAK